MITHFWHQIWDLRSVYLHLQSRRLKVAIFTLSNLTVVGEEIEFVLAGPFCARVNQDYTKIHKSNQYFPIFIKLIKLHLRMWPDADVVFRYVALPVHQLCCVPVRIIFHISDLVEEQADKLWPNQIIGSRQKLCMYNPSQTSLYLEHISLLKAKLVTFRCTKVVKSYCFHPESTELEVKPNPRRSMWVDVPPQNTEQRKGWRQRVSTPKQPVQRHTHCQTLCPDKWTERTSMRTCVGLKERKAETGMWEGGRGGSSCFSMF